MIVLAVYNKYRNYIFCSGPEYPTFHTAMVSTEGGLLVPRDCGGGDPRDVTDQLDGVPLLGCDSVGAGEVGDYNRGLCNTKSLIYHAVQSNSIKRYKHTQSPIYIYKKRISLL